MIFRIQDLNRILAHEKSLQEGLARQRYIKRAFAEVNEKLISHFGKKYLFHRAYFVSDDAPFEPLIFRDVLHRQHRVSVSHINLIEGVIGDSNILSFAKIILTQNIPGLVLYKGKAPGKLGEILFQNLRAANCELQFAGKVGVKKKDVSTLIEYYRLHASLIPGDFYAYFIRPFAEHKHYNGIFLLLLQRPLNENEFLEIRYLWTKILSETALIRERESEQELIFEEHTHTWNTEISAIALHLQMLKDADNRRDKNTTGYRQNLHAAFDKVQHLRDINSFNLLLLKTRSTGNKADFTDLKRHIGDENLYTMLKLKKQSIREIINDAMDTIAMQIRAMEFADRKTAEKKLEALERLRNSVKKQKDLHIMTVPIGLRIIVLDLLKNALFHADRSNPEVFVKIENDAQAVKIHFINNSILPQVVYDYINSDLISTGLSLKSKGGIRTIKRIVSTKLLSGSGGRWKIQAERSSLSDRADIVLLIPKSDLCRNQGK